MLKAVVQLLVESDEMRSRVTERSALNVTLGGINSSEGFLQDVEALSLLLSAGDGVSRDGARLCHGAQRCGALPVLQVDGGRREMIARSFNIGVALRQLRRELDSRAGRLRSFLGRDGLDDGRVPA